MGGGFAAEGGLADVADAFGLADALQGMVDVIDAAGIVVALERAGKIVIGKAEFEANVRASGDGGAEDEPVADDPGGEQGGDYGELDGEELQVAQGALLEEAGEGKRGEGGKESAEKQESDAPDGAGAERFLGPVGAFAPK